MRDLTTSANQEIIKENSGAAYIELVEITHEDLPSTIRLANNNENIVSNGNTFLAASFEIVMPTTNNDIAPSTEFRVSNVDRSITDAIQTISGRPEFRLMTIFSTDPDDVVVDIPNMIITSASADLVFVSAVVSLEDIMNQKVPGDTYTTKSNPGLF